MPTYTSASLLPWYPARRESGMKAKPGWGRVERGLLPL